MDNSNPYQAPESSPDEPNVPPGPRFRFRVIPALLVGFFGGIVLLMACIGPVGLIAMLYLDPTARRPVPFAILAAALCYLLFAFCGVAGLMASRAFMRGRWKVAFLLTLAMFALYGLPIGAARLANMWLRP